MDLKQLIQKRGEAETAVWLRLRRGDVRALSEGKLRPSPKTRELAEELAGQALVWPELAAVGARVLRGFMRAERWTPVLAARALGVSREHMNRVALGYVFPGADLRKRIAVWSEGAVPEGVWV